MPCTGRDGCLLTLAQHTRYDTATYPARESREAIVRDTRHAVTTCRRPDVHGNKRSTATQTTRTTRSPAQLQWTALPPSLPPSGGFAVEASLWAPGSIGRRHGTIQTPVKRTGLFHKRGRNIASSPTLCMSEVCAMVHLVAIGAEVFGVVAVEVSHQRRRALLVPERQRHLRRTCDGRAMVAMVQWVRARTFAR